VSVSQNGDRCEVIELVSEYFGCGAIRPDKSDKTVKWETRRLGDITERVLPHFMAVPLLSGKQRDVDILMTVSELMLSGAHLRRSGLLEIAAMASQMNPSGSRRYTLTQIEAHAR
jgi:hypothetical protein